MKINDQIYAEFYSAFARLDRERVARGLPGFCAVAADYRERGFSPLRFRFDWMYGAVSSRWVCDVVYPTGCNDDHIDTALRRVVRELTDDKNHWAAGK